MYTNTNVHLYMCTEHWVDTAATWWATEAAGGCWQCNPLDLCQISRSPQITPAVISTTADMVPSWHNYKHTCTQWCQMSGNIKGISRKKGWSNEERMDESREATMGSLSQWVRMRAGSFGGAVWYEYQELGWLGGMFDRITSAAPSAIILVCGKSLKRQ